jgi:type II secretory pathway component GspD/PulD (secretin)
VGIAVVVLGAGLYAASGQDKAPPPTTDPKQAEKAPGDRSRRIAYHARNITAKDLAAALGKHFKDDLEVQALPESAGNWLLISGSPAATEEVLALLDRLDRAPHQVAVEVLIAEVTTPKGAAGDAASRGVNERELRGPAREVMARVDELRQKGLLGSLKRIQLSGLENQRVRSQVGENRPIVTGVMATRVGTATRNISYQQTGTLVMFTPRIIPETKVIALELSVEDNRIHTPEDGVAIGTDEKGNAIRATQMIVSTLTTKLSVPSGHAVAASGVTTTAKSGPSQTLVIVRTEIVEDRPGGGK